MKDIFILLSPAFWSVKNDLLRFSKSFYIKTFLYALSGIVFIFLVTMLLNAGMDKLEGLSPEVFNLLLTKGYSLIFLIAFFIQIINGAIMSLDKYYQAQELEVLFTSPVNRTSLFFSRLFETHLKTSWMLIIFGIPLLASLGLQYQAHPAYYLYSAALLAVFSTIPVNIGISITIMMTGIFHLKKLKRFVFSASLITGAVIIILLRIFKPERFVNPELFANLTLFVNELQTPFFILLPNRWLSESLFNFLNKNYSDTLIVIPLLLLTSYLSVFCLVLIYRKYHYRGWSLLHRGDAVLKKKRKWTVISSGFTEKLILAKPAQLLQPLLSSQRITILKKDILCQFNDIKNIQQNIILISLIIVYLFSIASLPLNWEEYGVRLKYAVSFFNLGLILIIIAALCSKLVYPSIVSEGNSFWIIKTAPVTSKKYIYAKFFFLFIPIFILGQLLTIFSSFFINIAKEILLLNILTTSLLCFSLVSLAISFSVQDLKKAIKEDKSEEIKTGNTTYMVISVFFILFILALEFAPIYLYFLKAAAKVEFTQKAWLLLGAVIFVLLFVNILITAISMRQSIKKFDNIQLT